MKFKIFFVVIVLGLGYGIGRWQTPETIKEVEVVKYKTIYKTTTPSQADNSQQLVMQEPIKKQKTLADVYKPRKETRFNKDHVVKRVKQLKRYSASDFAQSENQ